MTDPSPAVTAPGGAGGQAAVGARQAGGAERAVVLRTLAGTVLAPYPLSFLALLAGAGYLATRYRIAPLAFNGQAFLNVAQVLAPLFMVSAFVERAVEVILTGLRGDDADKLQAEVDAAAAAAQTAPSADVATRLQELERRRLAFKSTSREVAFLLSTGLGIGAALCGIRALAGLLATAPPQAPTQAFTILDILLTGVVIGGGADGIHKIVQAILDFVATIPSKNG